MLTQDCPECPWGVPVGRLSPGTQQSPDLVAAASHEEGCPSCLPFQGSGRPYTGLPKGTSNSCAPRWVCFKSKLIELVLSYVITAKYVCIVALC